MATKNETKEFSLEELIMLEKMSRIVCTKYENTTKRYDGTIDNTQNSYNTFVKFNNIHTKIIQQMEDLLNKLF